jgi:hypothetical protein
MTPPETSPLLDLSTLEDARPVRIDGVLVPMLAATAIGAFEFHQLQGLAKLIVDFGEREYSADEGLEFDRRLRGAVAMVLPALPVDVLDSLSLPARLQIVNAFFGQPGWNAGGPQARETAPGPATASPSPTGAK